MTVIDRPSLDEAALLVIDVQETFTIMPRWGRRNNPDFEANVSALVAAFRAAGRPVIYVLHSDADEHWEATSPYHRLMDFLSPLPDEPTLHKTSANAFTTTNLAQLLVAQGVRRIVVTGIQTEQCCETTARVGSDLGFAVDFVTNATLTFPIQKVAGDDSVVLSTDEIVERTEYALRRRFARIATTGEIVRELQVAQPV